MAEYANRQSDEGENLVSLQVQFLARTLSERQLYLRAGRPDASLQVPNAIEGGKRERFARSPRRVEYARCRSGRETDLYDCATDVLPSA